MLKNIFNIKKNVFFTWFISYLFLIILSISISGFAYLQSTRLIKKEIEKSHTSTLKQLKQTLDSKLNDIYRIVKEINFSNRNIIIMNSGKDIEDYNRYVLNQLNYDVRIFKLANSFIDNIGIIYWNSDLALNCNGTSDIKQYYDFYFNNFNKDYDTWTKMMLKANKNYFVPLNDSTNLHKNNDDCIIYTKLLPLHIDKIEDVQATLCISIKKKTLEDMLCNLDCFKNSTIFILDKNDNIIASTKHKNSFVGLKYENLTNEHGIEYKNIDSQKIVLSYINADTTNWKYVLFTPTDTFLSKFNYIKNVILITIILYLIVGIIISLKLSQKNYVPVKKILQMFPMFNIKNDQKQNEFNFIENSVKQLLNKDKKIEKQIEKQKLELKSVYLTKLIQGRIYYNQISEKLSEDYNIDLNKGKFALVGIHIDDYSSLESSKMIASNQETIDLVNFIFKNIIKELVGSENNVYFVEVNNLLICLFNFKKYEIENSKEELLTIIKRTQNFIDKKIDIKYKIVLSKVYFKIEDISCAYEEILETMDIAILTSSELLDYENIITTKRNTKIDRYIIDHQELLINAIKSGDFTRAKEYLAHIFDKYIKEETYPVRKLQCRIYGLINSMLNAIGILCDKDFVDNLNFTNRLLDSKNIEQLYAEMNNMLDEVDVYINNIKSGEDNVLFKRVKDYVKNNYNDPNINVSVIAEKLNCNSTYMSRIVKKNTGNSMLEYLQKYRVYKSKEIIQKYDLSVKEVAEKVGFYNSHAYIRVFKKYEGTTPGKYIDSIKL